MLTNAEHRQQAGRLRIYWRTLGTMHLGTQLREATDPWLLPNFSVGFQARRCDSRVCGRFGRTNMTRGLRHAATGSEPGIERGIPIAVAMESAKRNRLPCQQQERQAFVAWR